MKQQNKESISIPVARPRRRRTVWRLEHAPKPVAGQESFDFNFPPDEGGDKDK